MTHPLAPAASPVAIGLRRTTFIRSAALSSQSGTSSPVSVGSGHESRARPPVQSIGRSPLHLAIALSFALAVVSTFSGCNGGDPTSMAQMDRASSLPPDTSQTDPGNPAPPATPSYSTQVMLFNGTGVSTSDWQTTEQIVKSMGLTYTLVNSAQLNAMNLGEIANYGLIIVPGGSGGTITSSLTTATRLLVRQAVRERGVSYLGFCAGAWVAVGPEATTSNVASYGLALASGAVLDLYLPGGQAPTAAIVDVSFADGSSRNLVWWGGPSTPEWSGGVVARYVDGEPAISETRAGNGYVIVSGPHPEAPQGWRATAGNDPDGLDYAIAIRLIQAALNKTPLATF